MGTSGDELSVGPDNHEGAIAKLTFLEANLLAVKVIMTNRAARLDRIAENIREFADLFPPER